MTLEKHFTATVFILHEKKVLLIYHRKHTKWLPPGGHIHPNETPPEAVMREAKEESGLDIALIPQENFWIERWNAKSFERPYLCLLEHAPAHNSQPAHLHMDLIYLAKPIGGTEKENPLESNGLKWFSLEEVLKLKSDEEIFLETQEILKSILI